MGLFFDVLSSINNPNQQGSVEQLGGIMNAIQQLSASNGIQPSTMQSAVSALGGALQPALRQQQMAGGGLDSLISQFAGGANPGMGALSSFLTPQLQQTITQAIGQKTGIGGGTIQAMLPVLVPAVMGLLSMGKTKPGVPGMPGVPGGNSLLNAFLDSDRSGSTDLGDVVRFAGRFLNPAR
jgi:hypothetical protein